MGLKVWSGREASRDDEQGSGEDGTVEVGYTVEVQCKDCDELLTESAKGVGKVFEMVVGKAGGIEVESLNVLLGDALVVEQSLLLVWDV